MRRVAYVLSALVGIAGAAPSSEAAQTTVESARSADPRLPERDPQNRRELQGTGPGALQQSAMPQVPSLLAATVNSYQTGLATPGASQSSTPMMDSIQRSISSGVKEFSIGVAQYMAPFVIDKMLPAGVDSVELVQQLISSRDLMTESINFITGVAGVPEDLQRAGMLPLTEGVRLLQPVLAGSGMAARTPMIETAPYAGVTAPMPQKATAQSPSMMAGAMNAISAIFGR